MNEYNFLGLENYIYEFMSNLEPKKDKRGFSSLEERYYKNINDNEFKRIVDRKIREKLADIISDNYINDLLDKG